LSRRTDHLALLEARNKNKRDQVELGTLNNKEPKLTIPTEQEAVTQSQTKKSQHKEDPKSIFSIDLSMITTKL
jgi:hypothetical protein